MNLEPDCDHRETYRHELNLWGQLEQMVLFRASPIWFGILYKELTEGGRAVRLKHPYCVVTFGKPWYELIDY